MTRPTLTFEAQTQVTTAELPLLGTPHSLHYRSDRVPGFNAARTRSIPVSSDSVPESLKRIELTVSVAGSVERQTLPPEPNQSYEFSWDAADAYGRRTQGFQTFEATVGYVYPGVYNTPAEREASFAKFARPDENHFASAIQGSQTRQEITLVSSFGGTLGVWDASAQGFGGWTLDAHHVYDPTTETLVLGTGDYRTDVAPMITTQAGANVFSGGVEPGPGVPAVDAAITAPIDVAVRPDGGHLLSEFYTDRIVSVAPDGRIDRVYADQGFGTPLDLGVGPRGAAYFVQHMGPVWRLDPGGTASVVAGGGDRTEDGVPATEAQLGYFGGTVGGIDVSPDGRLYMAVGDGRVRRVEQDGTITTVAGGGEQSREGVLATEHAVQAQDVAVGTDGQIYV